MKEQRGGQRQPMLDLNTSIHVHGCARSVAQAVRRVAAPRQSFYVRRVKSTLDRALAATLLVALAPLMVLLAALVRIVLGPGVIYRQQRIGLGGEPFTMLKFRTMAPDRRRGNGGEAVADRRLGADRRSGVERRRQQIALDHPERRSGVERRATQRRQVGGSRRQNHKSEHDPRHTRLGRLMRATSVDELPQLVNVLRGELSLVGPRPELPEVVARYEPWQHARHCIRPGLTGQWQISERGTGDPMHLHVDIDLDYVRKVSLGRDLFILALTLPAALGMYSRGRGR